MRARRATPSMIMLLLASATAGSPLGCSSEGSDSANAGGAGSAGTDSGGTGGGGTGSGGTGSGGTGGGSGAGGAGACGSTSPEAFAACVDAARYQADVTLITGERDPGSTHWQVVQDRCADVLTKSGFSIEKHEYGSGVNVVGTRTGKSKAGERVLIGAHYDHLPNCPGADDNATGAAGVLEMARVLSTGNFARTLVVVCFDEEETGYKGSKAYAARAVSTGENLVAVTIFDMIGFTNDAPNSQSMPSGFESAFPAQILELTNNQFRANFLLLAHDAASVGAGSVFEGSLEKSGRLAIRVDVPASLMSLSDLRRSDHAAFWDAGYPALFAGDTAEFRYPAYHCKNGDDVIANLNFEFATQVVRAATVSVATSLELEGAGGSGGGGGSGGSGGSGGYKTCADVCGFVPLASVAQGQCAANKLEQLGYPFSTTTACADVSTVPQCNACVSALGVTDAACVSAATGCF